MLRYVLIALAVIQGNLIWIFAWQWLRVMAAGGFDKTLFTQLAGLMLAVAYMLPMVGLSVCLAALQKPREQADHAATSSTG